MPRKPGMPAYGEFEVSELVAQGMTFRDIGEKFNITKEAAHSRYMYEQKPKIKTKCVRCGEPFTTKSIVNRYCSAECRTRAWNATQGKYDGGPCPSCGLMFKSRYLGKRFCCMDCYISSSEFKERQQQNLINMTPTLGVPRKCLRCDSEYPRSRRRKFCSNQCSRLFFAERFDRWVASPEGIALPQNFDEFLTKNELPCLVEGCQWSGSHLSQHVNMVHGITAREFKKLAGFNLRTGLVTPEVSNYLSERAKGLVEKGFGGNRPNINEKRHLIDHSYKSLEGKEHRKKSIAITHGVDSGKRLSCRECGKEVVQPYFGEKLYCSIPCRSRFYLRRSVGELNCSYCGAKFDAKPEQIRRVNKGMKVCCSLECRNKMNIAFCLSAQGRNPPSFANSYA